MSRGDEQRIADILDACDELDIIVQLRAHDSAPSSVLGRAAERLLEIIGEAASHISPETSARFPDVDWHSLSRLRILLAHHYHRTDPALIWQYATTQVPVLADALRD